MVVGIPDVVNHTSHVARTKRAKLAWTHPCQIGTESFSDFCEKRVAKKRTDYVMLLCLNVVKMLNLKCCILNSLTMALKHEVGRSSCLYVSTRDISILYAVVYQLLTHFRLITA